MRLVAGLLVMALLLVGVWVLARVPEAPSRTMVAEVISLQEVDGKGRRLIAVKFENGEEKVIETLAPFFFRPGYKAKVGVFERTLFPDVYNIVSDSVD